MKDGRIFCSLTPRGGNDYHPGGKAVDLTSDNINIGESADCDIRYDSASFQPEYYATIIHDDDCRGWYIIRRSQHTGISIEGKGEIGYACRLVNGDIIHFEGQQMALLFQVHRKQESNTTMRGAALWLAVGLLLFAVVFLFFGRKQEPISVADVTPLEESLYLIRTDSVKQLLIHHGNEIEQRRVKILSGEAPTGTAFLTTDGILVTARHCVEYWIGASVDLTRKYKSLADDDIVKWAIETETFNQAQHEDSTMQLRAFFSIYDFMGEQKFAFHSADPRVHINTAKDGIFLLADFNQDYYWRTIQPYFQDSQMEMGDVLWIDGFAEKGKIALASEQELQELPKGASLMVCGYPITNSNTRRVTYSEGTIKQDLHPEAENIVFEANINHGFSGGPVLTKTSDGIVAVGIVSRVDSISSGIFKRAVPSSVILNMKGGPDNE